MKHLLTILVAMTIVSVNVFAQYAYEAQSNETEEISFDLNDYPEKIGKGVHMSDAGKTLLFTGASVALTGVACFIGGAAMYDPNPDAPDMPMYPLFAMAGAAAGGVIALIGLPFYFYGKEKMNTYGSSHITFGNEDQEGGAGFFEMGLGIPNFLSLDAVGGYNFGKNFFMGAGVGYKTYLTAGLRYDGATASLPIYTNFRYSIGKKRVVPYIGASLGYDVVNTGLYSGLEFGTRLRKLQGNRGQSWWIGAKSEFILPEGMTISLKVGRSF
jgi:hypothetical protein